MVDSATVAVCCVFSIEALEAASHDRPLIVTFVIVICSERSRDLDDYDQWMCAMAKQYHPK